MWLSDGILDLLTLMLVHKSFVSILLCCLGVNVLFAQVTDSLSISEVEELVESNPDLSEEADRLSERLQILLENPVPINYASEEELSVLVEVGLITYEQLREIIRYREAYGPFDGPAALQAVPSLTPEDIQRITPFISWNIKPGRLKTLGNLLWDMKHVMAVTARRRTELEKYYTTPDPQLRFLGDPWKLQIRYRGYHDLLSWGFTLEKDPGEPLFAFPNKPTWYAPWKGFDFSSAYVDFSPANVKKSLFKLSRILLGDYNVRWGQGLIVWTDFSWRKSSRVSAFMKEGEGFRPYTSVVEYRMMRGIAAEIKLWRFLIQGFYSRVRLSAASVLNTDTAETLITRINIGYHRNWKELRYRKSLPVQTTGLRLAFTSSRGNLSVYGVLTELQKPLSVYYSRLYNLFYLTGKRFSNIGLSWSLFPIGKIRLAGEAALNLERNVWSIVSGLRITPYRRFQIGFLYRYYDPAYMAFHAQPFAEYYRGQNEEGVYICAEYNPKRGLFFSGYLDIYRHPWFRWGRDIPSHGVDWLVRTGYRFTRHSSIYIQWRHERYLRTAFTDLPLDTAQNIMYGYFRMHFDITTLNLVRLQTRFQLSYQGVEESIYELGYMGYIQVGVSVRRHVKVIARIVHFYTPSWDTRIYAFEPDLLYTYPVVVHYGLGVRYVLLVNLYAGKNARLKFKIARTEWFDRKSVGAGLNNVPVPYRTEIALQVLKYF